MTLARLNGLDIAYELIGEGRPWAITPGGRFSKDYPGVRELAEALAAGGSQVLIWDRPNCGASDLCFTSTSESAMQADTLAALIRALGLGPTVIAGGSGGARVAMLTAARHRDVAAGLAVWWISGGAFGLMSLGVHYCGQSLAKAWEDGMEAVIALPEWQEVLTRNPSNRQRFLDQDRLEFVATMERWMLAYCPREDDLVPGLPNAEARSIDIPTLVFRSGESDAYHTRATSEEIAKVLPRARLIEPPWGDREWIERLAATSTGGSLFERWRLLAPQLIEWSRQFLG
jgi:pimeloyl-ACP methyl ester carboxylesterase